jgi:hypothetical protein
MVVGMTISKSLGKKTEKSDTKLATLIQHFLHAKRAQGTIVRNVQQPMDSLLEMIRGVKQDKQPTSGVLLH